MDLLSEASSGTRILTARHISSEKTFPVQNNAINTTLLCHSYSIQPDVDSYIAALQCYAWVLWTCALLVLLAICGLYVVTVRAALQHWRECIVSAAVVLAVYPLVAASAFLVLVVPRSRVLSEALSQQAVMVAMYHLYCMVIAECGGAEKLLRQAGGDSRLETRVLPCCCWPCCVIPRPKLERRSLSWLRCLVLQMPVVQGLLYVIILVLWAEDMMLYVRSFTYIQPFVIASILSGVWGMIMCVRAAEAAGSSPRPRFLALQLVLLIVKLQCGLAKLLPEVFTLPCIVSLHPSVFVHMIENSVMMVEMLLLSLWAWRLYRVPPGKVADKVQKVVVAVLDDGGCTDVKAMKDGVDKIASSNELKY